MRLASGEFWRRAVRTAAHCSDSGMERARRASRRGEAGVAPRETS